MYKSTALRCFRVSVVFFISLLFFVQGSAFAEDMSFGLIQGLNGISLPFENTGINNAEGLAQSISNCEFVSYWDAQTQGYVVHEIGSAENNFPLTPGYPYFVTVSQNTIWTVSGDIPPYFTFNLTTTIDSTNVNAVTLPVDRRPDIGTAEELAQDIPNCTTVWYWDADLQGYIGHPVGTEINDFSVYHGYPYFADVTENTVWPVDNTSPSINITSPFDGQFVNTLTPNITITFSDSDSGIDTSSFSTEINGVDSTSLFTVTGTGASYQVTADLPVGDNVITASIGDNGGNTSSSTSNFTASIMRAIPGANLTTGYAPLTVHFSTDGEDPAGTIIIFRWDFYGDGSWDTYDTVARNYTRTYNTPGTYNATLFVQSSSGLTATESITITVENNPPVATANAVPSNGAIPLTVQFLGSGTDSDGQVVLYEWDFDGNGTYDWSSTTAGNTSHSYPTVGTYNAVFRVTDNDGAEGTAHPITTMVVAAQEGSPTAQGNAAPSSGNAPLAVNFSGTGTDPDLGGTIVLYEWDFDNDGVYDWSSTSNGTTSHTYNAAGTHIARFRVTDNTGLTGVDYLLIFVDIQTSLSIAKDTVGFLPSSSGMSASASSQNSSSVAPNKAVDGNTGTYWYTAYQRTPYYGYNAWFEVSFDTPQKISSFTVRWYNSSYYKMLRARVEIYDINDNILYSQETDFSGSVSQVDIPDVENASRLRLVAITNSGPYYYYILIREFEVDSTPMSSGSPEPTGSNINTYISAATQVSVLIKDSNRNIVRTLVNNEYRSLGNYSDYWDVKDNDGFMVNDGTYYAVLQYLVDGQVKEKDLSDTTGGTRYNFPTGSACNTRNTVRSSFTPYEDDLLPITFRLCKASEVTIFIGPLWSGGSATRVRTILNRKALAKGEHTVYWDGLDDDGNIAHPPPGDRLITGFWRYTLPDNAMYVTGGRPVISSVSSEPNYFNPLSNTCSENGNSVNVTYSLSEDASKIELRVISLSTKNTVRVVKEYNLSAGENHIFWDGKNTWENFVEQRDYQLVLSAIDGEGNKSLLTSVNLIRLTY